MDKQNLFNDLPEGVLPEEIFSTLAEGKSFALKKIISTGQSTPEVGWYDQEQHEWVVVLQGSATIEFEHQGEVQLTAGDYLCIKAKTKHKVSYTDLKKPTVWLAIYYDI